MPERAAGDVQARLEQRALELEQSFELLDALLDGPLRPARATLDRARSARSGSAASRARAARRAASSSATATAIERLHLRTGSYANWPVGRARRRRQPAARLPAHQQELRALLRLRRPLMLTLLRDLRRLRRELGAPAARPRGGSLALRHVDAGSCNGCEHELTLASSPYYDLQRFGLGVVASPRHADVLLVTGAVTTPHARAAARRLRRDARAAPRRRARRLRARLQPARPPRTSSSARSRRSCPSTSASPAARPRRTAIAEALLTPARFHDPLG